ncbi:MAG: GNAT family N-acetyltransferase [Promethearchaeota archaeon]|nr:MAG: GNAT family N-acetyltransferase [Candidatus Lokiarchaeota archaeon]
MDFQIRQATIDDIDSIILLWRELSVLHERLDSSFELDSDAETHYFSYLHLILESQLKNEAFLFVAEIKNTKKIVGYIMGVRAKNPPVFKTKEFGSIYDICVTEKYRRQDIGEYLVLEAKTWCKNHGLNRVEMSAAPTNPTAIAFWKKMGFTPYMQKMYFSS